MTYLSFSLLILYVIVSNLGFGEFTKLFIYLGLTFAFWIVNYHLTFDNEDKTMILKMRDAVLNYINKTKTVSL
jgi:positive regulator of sigma E activity